MFVLVLDTVSIDESAVSVAKTALENAHKTALRLMVKSFGWNGPSLGVALDEQREGDYSTEKSGIKLVAEQDIAFLFENTGIVSLRMPNGTMLSVIKTRWLDNG